MAGLWGNDNTKIATEDQSPSLSDMLEDFLTPQLQLEPDPVRHDEQYGLYVSRLALDIPIEMQMLRDEKEQLMFGISPPSQWIETSVEPVLHRLRVSFELDEYSESEDGAPRD